MNETKRFSLRDILTVTTGRLLTKRLAADDNGIGSLYKILDWMTGDESYTHTLGRFAAECKPWLLRWFPELAKANDDLYAMDGFVKSMQVDHAIEQWLSICVAKGCKKSYDVPRIPKDDHETKDPVQEMLDIVGDAKVIVVQA